MSVNEIIEREFARLTEAITNVNAIYDDLRQQLIAAKAREDEMRRFLKLYANDTSWSNTESVTPSLHSVENWVWKSKGSAPAPAQECLARLYGEKYNRPEIPPGPYCYIPIGPMDEVGRMPIKRCPYWSRSTEHEYQNNGYCSLLQQGDWEMEGTFLLWNQCKECGINIDEESDT